jgi:drug/metabolite transporter (DMT)-like permease
MPPGSTTPARGLALLGRRVPMAPIGLGVVLYSVGPVFVQASSASGPVFSFWRLWFGVLVLGIAALAHGAMTQQWPDPRAWGWAVGAGIAFGGHQLLLFTAIKATTVADVTLLSALGPLVTALLALPFFGERPGRAFRLWSLVAMSGAAVVAVGGASGPQGDPWGMTLALGNVVFFAVFFLLSKASRGRLAVLPFLFGVMTVAAITVSGYVVAADEPIGAVATTDLLYAAIVAVAPGFLGHVVMTWPLGWVPANVPPVMRLGVPVLASVWAWWFLGEAITVAHLGGGLLTLLGVGGAVLSPAGRRFLNGTSSEEDASADPVAANPGR